MNEIELKRILENHQNQIKTMLEVVENLNKQNGELGMMILDLEARIEALENKKAQGKKP